MRLSRVKISNMGRFWSLSEVLLEASKVPLSSVLNSIPNSQKNLMIAIFAVLIALDFPFFSRWLEAVLQSLLYTGCLFSGHPLAAALRRHSAANARSRPPVPAAAA